MLAQLNDPSCRWVQTNERKNGNQGNQIRINELTLVDEVEQVGGQPRTTKPKGRYGKYLRRQLQNRRSLLRRAVSGLEQQQKNGSRHDANKETNRGSSNHAVSPRDF